jgi:hypothetical protein
MRNQMAARINRCRKRLEREAAKRRPKIGREKKQKKEKETKQNALALQPCPPVAGFGRRGWPPAHVSAPERCYKLLDGARGVSHERAVPRWPSARRLRPPRAAICFPPLRSPGHPSARHLARREGGWCGLGAPGGGPVAQFLPFGVHCTGAVSRCSGGRTCHRPVTHRAHPSAKGGCYASRRL